MKKGKKYRIRFITNKIIYFWILEKKFRTIMAQSNQNKGAWKSKITPCMIIMNNDTEGLVSDEIQMMIIVLEGWKEAMGRWAAESRRRWGQDYKFVPELMLVEGEIKALGAMKQRVEPRFQAVKELLWGRALRVRRETIVSTGVFEDARKAYEEEGHITKGYENVFGALTKVSVRWSYICSKRKTRDMCHGDVKERSTGWKW
jgi:hypothetical protein